MFRWKTCDVIAIKHMGRGRGSNLISTTTTLSHTYTYTYDRFIATLSHTYTYIYDRFIATVYRLMVTKKKDLGNALHPEIFRISTSAIYSHP